MYLDSNFDLHLHDADLSVVVEHVGVLGGELLLHDLEGHHHAHEECLLPAVVQIEAQAGQDGAESVKRNGAVVFWP